MIFLKIQEINSYVALFNNKRVLLLKRRNNLWEFPGGGVEWGETPEKAAERELKEETSLQAGKLELLGVTSAVYEKNGDEKHSIYLIYKSGCTSDDVKISGEHKEYRWLNMHELSFMTSKMGLNARDAVGFITAP